MAEGPYGESLSEYEHEIQCWGTTRERTWIVNGMDFNAEGLWVKACRNPSYTSSCWGTLSEGTWAEIWLDTSAEGLRVKAHGNVDIIEFGAEGQNVKALDSLQNSWNMMTRHLTVIRNENLYWNMKELSCALSQQELVIFHEIIRMLIWLWYQIVTPHPRYSLSLGVSVKPHSL